MRTRPERLTAFSGFAALALGAFGTLFERANPSVLQAGPEEFRSWARTHHDALVAQSVIFSLGGAPLLLFFAGLRAVLDQRERTDGAGGVDLSLVVLGGGALWVTVQLVGQAIQVMMASAAAHGEHAGFVVSLRDLMRSVLRIGNLPLAAACGACAVLTQRHRALPGWLAAVSAATAVASLLPVVPERMRRGPVAGESASYLSYPAFVGWMGATAVTLHRKGRAPRTG